MIYFSGSWIKIKGLCNWKKRQCQYTIYEDEEYLVFCVLTDHFPHVVS